MKKFFAMMLSLLMVFSLVACGAKPNDTSTDDPGTDGDKTLDWPTSNIEVVVPYNPGGDTDTYARALLEDLSSTLGVTVSITNMTGSSGAVAAEQAARASE